MKKKHIVIGLAAAALCVCAAVLLALFYAQAAAVPVTSDEMPVQQLSIVLLAALALFAGLSLYKAFGGKRQSRPHNKTEEHDEQK